MKIIASIIFTLWLLLGLYFGIGGFVKADYFISKEKVKSEISKSDTVSVEYDDILFENKASLKRYVEKQSIESIFPWVFKTSDFTGTIITACAFGILGAVIQLLRQIVTVNKRPDELQYISLPLLGMMTSIVTLGITYLLPTIILTNGGAFNPTTLMFLSLFAGLYSEKFYEKVSSYFNKLFKPE